MSAGASDDREHEGRAGALRLVVVRHATTVADPAVPAAEWPLADEPLPAGFIASLERCASWVSSPEPKAQLTARRITDEPVSIDPRLREVERGGWLDDYDAAVDRHLTAPDEPAAHGWETATAARRRLHQWLGDLPTGLAGSVGVVTHGLAMTHIHLLLTGQAPTLAWWQGLAMPDIRTYDLSDRGPAPHQLRGA